jgi:prefoldin subunit 5
MMQLDVNAVINDLTIQIATLTKENAILKASVSQYQKALELINSGPKTTDGGELESA